MRVLRLPAALLGAALVLGAGCKPKPRPPEEAVPVQVLEVAAAPIARALEYDGDVKGTLEVKVFSQVPERILAMRVEEGREVKQGEVMAIVRAEALAEGVQGAQAALDAAKVGRDNLSAELERQTKLLERKIVSQSAVDQMRARLLAAEADIRRMEAMTRQASTARGNAVVRAPIAGTVGRCLLRQGDLALPTIPICTIVQAAQVELVLEVPEQDLSLVREGMTARLSVARYPGQTFVGTVDRIFPTIDRLTRTAQARVRVENKDRRLMSGMLARVRLEVERKEAAIVVPYSSLIIEIGASGEATHRAFVVKNGNRAEERTLTLGIVDDSRVEVTSGLAAGDALVSRGQHLLRPGREVQIVERLGADLKTIEAVTPAAKRARP